jgi:hypothetical protein
MERWEEGVQQMDSEVAQPKRIYTVHITIELSREHIIVIRSLVAIYFSETCNICTVRVSNREIWHSYTGR